MSMVSMVSMVSINDHLNPVRANPHLHRSPPTAGGPKAVRARSAVILLVGLFRRHLVCAARCRSVERAAGGLWWQLPFQPPLVCGAILRPFGLAPSLRPFHGPRRLAVFPRPASRSPPSPPPPACSRHRLLHPSPSSPLPPCCSPRSPRSGCSRGSRGRCSCGHFKIRLHLCLRLGIRLRLTITLLCPEQQRFDTCAV
jgi:hypothetical protein